VIAPSDQPPESEKESHEPAIVPLINQVQAQTKGIITETSLELAEDLTYEEWKELGVSLARIEQATNWWLGDWWAYATHRYGDRKDLTSQDDWTGPSFQTCMAAGSVCRAFETCRRREVLSFSHHREVAALEREVADKLLDWCEEPLKSGGKRPHSVTDLRVRVMGIRAGRELQDSESSEISSAEAPSASNEPKFIGESGYEVDASGNFTEEGRRQLEKDARREPTMFDEVGDALTAEVELKQETEHGITDQEAEPEENEVLSEDIGHSPVGLDLPQSVDEQQWEEIGRKLGRRKHASRENSPEAAALLALPEKTVDAPKSSQWVAAIKTAQEAIRELERLQESYQVHIDFGPVKKILDEAERLPIGLATT
jgi:hypothetical protein